MKYTLVGLVLGLVIYLLILQIIDKTPQNILYYAGLFMVGMIIGTLPIAIYFTYHNAWGTLWDAYFYKLLFEYKLSDINAYAFGTTLFWKEYIATTAFTAIAFIYSILSMFRNAKENRHQYGSILAMILFQAIGISFSRNWVYTAECMHVYNTLGITMFLLAITECVELVRKNGNKLVELMEANKNVCDKIFIAIVTIAGMLLLVNSEFFLFPVLYLSLFGIIFICYIKNANKVESLLRKWKQEYREKRNTINVLVPVLSMVLLASYTYSFSDTSHAIGIPLEEYPQYKISKYILDSGIENPILINYDTTDAGIYGITGTKPPTKWVGDYNANFADVNDMYDEYIGEQKADFIVAESGELEFEGYELVLSPGITEFVHEGRTIEFFLYEKR